MKKLLVVFIFFQFIPGYSQVIISEFLPKNQSTICDELGDYDDWIELYNPNDYEVEIGGLVMKNVSHIWGIPTGDASTLLAPGSYFLIWADHEEAEGLFHANFRLSANESLTICEADSSTIIDTATVPDLDDDISYGVCPGTGWTVFDVPTPMAPNNCSSSSGKAFSSDEFSVFPTTTNDEILLKVSNPANESIKIKLVSVSGAVLFGKSFTGNECAISLGQYKCGVYNVIIEMQNHFFCEKVVKIE